MKWPNLLVPIKSVNNDPEQFAEAHSSHTSHTNITKIRILSFLYSITPKTQNKTQLSRNP